MSKRSYWGIRPACGMVYLRREASGNSDNMRILSSGIKAAAAMLGVVGVCIANVELIAASGILAVTSRYITALY